MNWRVALIALAAAAAVALLIWLLQGGEPGVEQVEVLEVEDMPTPTPTTTLTDGPFERAQRDRRAGAHARWGRSRSALAAAAGCFRWKTAQSYSGR